jgi:hypothetical protein
VDGDRFTFHYGPVTHSENGPILGRLGFLSVAEQQARGELGRVTLIVCHASARWFDLLECPARPSPAKMNAPPRIFKMSQALWNAEAKISL